MAATEKCSTKEEGSQWLLYREVFYKESWLEKCATKKEGSEWLLQRSVLQRERIREVLDYKERRVPMAALEKSSAKKESS